MVIDFSSGAAISPYNILSRWPYTDPDFFVTNRLETVLTMARSFGSFFYFLCQNLSTAIPDARILEQLHTNIRWSLTLRGSPRDAQFLRTALPVTGRMERPEPRPFHERTLYFG